MHTELKNVATYNNDGLSNVVHRDEYVQLLDPHSFKFKLVEFYLQVGELEAKNGWILHISIVTTQFADLFNIIAPTLLSHKVSFRIPANRSVADQILSGGLGYTELGKIISIYPTDDLVAESLARILVRLTKPFKGPSILTAIHLGGTLYTQYGSFSTLRSDDTYEANESLINDKKPHQAKNIFHVPVQVPAAVVWPFSSIIALEQPKVPTVFKRKYKPISIIKADAKGRVLLANYCKSFIRTQKCIIKEARKYIALDEHGRDITSRLKWQYELHTKLLGKLPVPRIIDFFDHNDSSYFVMEFINGTTLDLEVKRIFNSRSWTGLENSERLRLLDYIIDLIEVVETLHKNGYVHRDIMPGNFMLTKNGKIQLIDLELTYSINDSLPDPPFTYGTYGYMSPEQQRVLMPTFKDDIFSIGALLTMCLTGFEPFKFEISRPDVFEEQLMYFVKDKQLVTLAKNCISPEPDCRPDTNTLLEVIKEQREDYARGAYRDHAYATSPQLDATHLKETIEGGMTAIASDLMSTPDKLWFARTRSENQKISNEIRAQSIYPGLGEGISGVFYVLARLKRAGFHFESFNEICAANLTYLQRRFLNNLSHVPPGLYNGAAGVAVALAEGIRSGLIHLNERSSKLIQSCLQLKPDGLDLENGAAGTILAALNCAPFIKTSDLNQTLERMVDLIIGNQQANGAWALDAKTPLIHAFEPSHWLNGAAGIACSLTLLTSHCHDTKISDSANRALRWLEGQVRSKGNSPSLTNSKKEHINLPWLNDGLTGIALSFLRAYSVYGDTSYRYTAESLLRCHPKQLVTQLLGSGWGLSGIGEVYLEAYEILKSEEWLDRAKGIVSILVNCCRHTERSGVYWITDTGRFPTASLMTGNSGVLHFLNRLINIGQFSMPLLPEI